MTVRNGGLAGNPRDRAFLAGLTMVVAIMAVSLPSAASAAAGCPNEQFRSGPSAALPDCRAYELVSPLRSEPEAASNHITPVSAPGDQIGFYSQFGPAPGFRRREPRPLLSLRAGRGGLVDSRSNSAAVHQYLGLFCSAVVAGYSTDLSRAVLADGWNWTGYPQRPDNNAGTASCEQGKPLLAPGEGQGAQNIFLHETGAPNEAGFYQLLNPTPSGVGARDAYFQAGSSTQPHRVHLALAADP